MSTAAPTVSVIVPTLNERAYIRDLLDSIEQQDYGNIAEVLIVDGGSDDGTRDILERHTSVAELVDNPNVTAASAMNVGIEHAKGEVIVRLDAHARYEPDYVRRCVEVLEETGADNVGGPMRPVGRSAFGRAVAAVTTSRFGVGPGAFHFEVDRRDVDTVFLGCWPREVLERLGGFDTEQLQWAAEDHELNYRLTESGGRIVLDPSIRSVYFPRETPWSLARQYFNYGIGKASTLAKHRRLPTLRPLAPAALVAGSAVAVVATRGAARFALPIVHLGAAGVAALRLGRDNGVAPHRAAGAILVCHWSYGAGFLTGLGRWLRGRGFDTRRRQAN